MNCWRGVLVHSIFCTAQPIYFATRYFLNPEYIKHLSPVWLAVTVIVYIYIVTRLSIPFFTSPLRHAPTAPGEIFPIGHFRPLGNRPPTDILQRVVDNTPNDGLVVLWALFYLRCEVIPTRPDTIMEVVNTNNYDWEKPGTAKKFLARILGEGLINVEGNVHKAMRRAVAPAFSGRNIRDLVPLFYRKGIAFAESMAREAKNSADGALEMMHQMSRVTLDIIGAAGVGKDFNTIENDEDPLARLYATLTDTNRGSIFVFFMINVMLPPWFVRRLGNTVHAKVARAQLQLRQDVRALMAEKKRLMHEKTVQQNDIIATIMKSGDFPDDYLVSQLLTFLAAGHDTTASALTWTVWLLYKHPEMQDRLRAECVKHLSNKNLSEVDATTFDNMPYLTAICNETLRLYPTVPVTARQNIKPTTIGRYLIPKSTVCLIAPWPINRSPVLWGDDANEYNPDRWLKGPDATNGGASSPYSLITFLHGPRSCIGQSFARQEMKCILAALILRFRFEMADPNEEVEVGGFVTIKPLHGLRMKLHDLQAEKAS